MPKTAQEAINNSLKASSRGREKSLKSLGDTNPAKAAKIRFEFANNRINSIKGNASKEKLVNERVREYANEMNNTQELIKKANTENMNVTALEEKVANATSKHLTVLKNVHDKVPEPAKNAIKHAMNVSVRGHKKALENLQDKNPEKAEMIKKNIPDFAKSKKPLKTQVTKPVLIWTKTTAKNNLPEIPVIKVRIIEVMSPRTANTTNLNSYFFTKNNKLIGT